MPAHRAATAVTVIAGATLLVAVTVIGINAVRGGLSGKPVDMYADGAEPAPPVVHNQPSSTDYADGGTTDVMQPLPDGIYRLRADESGRCLGMVSYLGRPVLAQTNCAAGAVALDLRAQTSGYQIQLDDGCATVDYGMSVDDRLITGRECNPAGHHQRYVFEATADGAGYRIKAAHSGQCLDSGSDKFGAPIRQVDCDADADTQVFTAEPVT